MTPEQQRYTVEYMERNYPQGVAAVRAEERENIAEAIEDYEDRCREMAKGNQSRSMEMAHRHRATAFAQASKLARNADDSRFSDPAHAEYESVRAEHEDGGT